MSKRHWIRDKFDFTGLEFANHPFENCGDDCEICNTRAREIADSLALDRLECYAQWDAPGDTDLNNYAFFHVKEGF